MMNVVQAVFAKLNTDWRTYYEEAYASENDPIPSDYIVYKFPPSSSEKNRDLLILEVNFWTYLNGRDVTHLENIFTQIDRELRGYMHLDVNQFLKFQKLGGGAIADPNPNVRRRELRYLIKREERDDN